MNNLFQKLWSRLSLPFRKLRLKILIWHCHDMMVGYKNLSLYPTLTPAERQKYIKQYRACMKEDEKQLNTL